MRTMDSNTLNLFLAESDLPYETISKLPASGQRDVYLADGLHDGRQYVIKITHYDKYTIGRIQREITILKDINSSYFPTIVLDTFVADSILDQYYDNLSTAQNCLGEQYAAIKEEISKEIEAYHNEPIRPFYLTVENFIENIPWNDFMASADEMTVCKFSEHCFKALDLLWSHKIVHRDLKPANILIRPDNTPVIIDLGIAKSFKDGTIDLTPGFIKNPHTVRFASPEQLLDRKDIINYKTDQYSIGLIIYHLLCGGYAFGRIEDIGINELVINMINFKYIPIASAGGSCCQSFENFITKLIQPEPHQRYRTTEKIFQTLEEIQGVLQ